MQPQASEQKKTAKRYLTISFSLHAGLFLFLLFGQLVFPSKALVFNPAVQIDMVALPSQVKQENPDPIDTTLKVKENPPPPPEEKAQPDEPEPAPIKAPTPPKDSAKEAKNALERLREQVKKNESKKQAENKKQQQEQLNKRKEDLKRFEETYRNAISGNQVHKGTNSTGDMAETLNAYGGHITERLRSNWGLPVWLQGKGLRAVVRIYIDGRGTVTQVTFLQRSGNDVFDEYVKTSVQKSSPFAPPPEDLAKGLRNTGVEVLFPL
ncbi:MAG: TonB family protein [Bacteriovoracia bacterium]